MKKLKNTGSAQLWHFGILHFAFWFSTENMDFLEITLRLILWDTDLWIMCGLYQICFNQLINLG